jgi:hypothetical protein
MRSLTKKFPINVIWFAPPPSKKEEEKKTGLPGFFVRQTLGDLIWKDGMGLICEQHEIVSKLLDPSPRQLTIQCDHSALQS